MRTTRLFLSAVIFALLMGLGTSAHATLWEIDAVLTGAGVSGYGASSFHRATDASPMSGANLGDITAQTGSFGTWDDVTGIFDATFDLSGAASGIVDVDGTLGFGANYLDALYVLTVSFSGSDLFGAPNDGDLYFEAGHVCCEAIEGPNGIVSDGTGKIITLWGANGYNNGYAGGGDTDLGMDLRVHIRKVPEPVSLMLMGLGLLGLSFRSRKASV